MNTVFRIIFFFIFISTTFCSWSQTTIIPFNETIGDVIDSVEQQKYSLFVDIIDSSIVHSELHKKGNNYFLVSYSEKDTTETSIDYEDIVFYRKLAEKIDGYSNELSQPDSTQEQSLLVINRPEQKITAPLTNDELNEKMRKEARRFQILKSEADRLGLQGLERQNYLDSGGSVIGKTLISPKNYPKN